ncbi:hypothetical protein RMATCC62417_02162 [Rhizopus microsporus]|nr:hypothetical protein RMATCC62417_02162 [Rhizopus microsporus]
MRIFKGYFLQQQQLQQRQRQQQQQQQPQPQQRQIRLPIMSLANKAANRIINHTLFDEIVFEEEEEKRTLKYEILAI